MEIKVLGTGCASCKKLLGLTQDAVRELKAGASVIYVTDMKEIMKTGIMSTPGLIINGKVKSVGRVPAIKEIKQMITMNCNRMRCRFAFKRGVNG